MSSDSAALERIILNMNTQPNQNSISYNKKIDNIESIITELLTKYESNINEKILETSETVIKEEPRKRGKTFAEFYGLPVETTPDEEIKKSYIDKLKMGFSNR